MECSGSPKGSLGTPWFFELLKNLFFLFPREKRRPARPPFRKETVNAMALINLLHRTFTKTKGMHGLLSGTTRQEQDDNRTSSIGFLVTGTLRRIQIGQRCILGIGSKIASGHET
jgi:hypothetical protein